ncbi:MAG: glycoside hydrolase family 32 protein [Promethearchaeota archaeon]
MKENIDVNFAMKNLKKARKIAERCPLRPKYHFLAPAYWMNDPHGLIYYKGEYHIFYQHNPYGVEWGTLHWGHAKSKDLVFWEHLPLALVPSKRKNEENCYSGSCIVNNGIPTIIYTSIGSDKPQTTGAEQWLAISTDDMISWQKSEKNPIMTLELHKSKDLDIREWRDPYVWKEKDNYYAVLAGYIYKPHQSVILLYSSTNLIDWKFIKILTKGHFKKRIKWECPNFFSIKSKHILIVSSFRNQIYTKEVHAIDRHVFYTLGTYKNTQFEHDEWRILDQGSLFYAPSTMIDSRGRVIMWGWLSARGTKGWNGCLTLPRILTLRFDNKLGFKPAPELESLRKNHYSFDQLATHDSLNDSLKAIKSNCLELLVRFKLTNKDLIGIKFNEIDESQSIIYSQKSNQIKIGKEEFNFFLSNDEKFLELHIFIDNSIIEVFINKRECFSGQLYSQPNNSLSLSIISEDNNNINNLDIWELKNIWEKKNN